MNRRVVLDVDSFLSEAELGILPQRSNESSLGQQEIETKPLSCNAAFPINVNHPCG